MDRTARDGRAGGSEEKWKSWGGQDGCHGQESKVKEGLAINSRIPDREDLGDPWRYYLIKISNDLIEQPQTLKPLVVDVGFGVKLLEVWD